jgi:4-amino-4-deoxy-L-arabinose transferase-like glycosyltransferase
VAAGLWIALPRSVGSREVGTPGDRLERFAYLEPITALWMVVAVWFGWRLHRHGRGIDAVALGVAIGLATASKVSGVFVAVPIAAFLLVTAGRRVVAPLAGAAAVSVITFLATYAPFGRTANEALETMYRLQRDHAEAGHAVYVRGQSTSHPPWYTELWYHYDADGPWLTLATVVLVAVAVAASGRRRAAGYLLGVVAGIYLLLSFLPVEIRHYRFVVWPPLVVLLAAGIVALAGPIARGWRIAGIGAATVVVIAGVLSLGRLATLHPEDYAALHAELTARSVPDDAAVAVFGPVHVAAHHLPGHPVVSGADPAAGAATVVLVDRTYTVRFGEPPITGWTETFSDGRVTAFLWE